MSDTDYILACRGRKFPVHKIILATRSSYLREHIRAQEHLKYDGNSHQLSNSPHPPAQGIFLKGIDPNHLEKLIDYMYGKEVLVPNEDLTGFLETAAKLKVSVVRKGQFF